MGHEATTPLDTDDDVTVAELLKAVAGDDLLVGQTADFHPTDGRVLEDSEDQTVHVGNGSSWIQDPALKLSDSLVGETDSFPGFTTSITTTGFKVIAAAFLMNSTTSEAAVLEISFDGGTTFNTYMDHPSGLSDKTMPFATAIGPNDDLQFQDGSAGSAAVTNSEYQVRELLGA